MKVFQRAFILLSIFCWMALLHSTDSIYSVYLLIGICALFARINNEKKKRSGTRACIWLAVLFDLMVLLANYGMFGDLTMAEKIFSVVFLPIGGFLVFYNILVWLRAFTLRFSWKKKRYKMSPRRVFLLCFGGLCLLFLLTQLLCCYPGVVTGDSVFQLNMIDTDAYIDHHPFYHTMLIRLFYGTAMAIFGNQEVAVYCYCAAQAIMMAAIFAYTITTLYQLKINKKVIIGVLAIFALLPCHLIYSFTLWKDVLFGGGVLMFTVALYRYFKQIGKSQILNIILMVMGAFLICLIRSNGCYVFVVLVAVFFAMYYKTHLKIAIILFSVLAISFGLKMITPAMGVVPTEPTEYYSIPLQQVARVVVADGNLTDEEREKIEKLAPMNEIKKRYLPYLSDPIKLLIRDRGMETYFAIHKKEYTSLWINVGLRNPKLYAEAWIDQTRGYWNGGYDYWNIMIKNNLNPVRDEEPSFFYRMLRKYLSFFNDFSVLRILLSIGLFVWITIIILYLSLVRGDKDLVFLTLTPLGVIATLLISTPVFAEFRYAYAVFCCFPFLLPVLFVGKAKKAKRSKK